MKKPEKVIHNQKKISEEQNAQMVDLLELADKDFKIITRNMLNNLQQMIYRMVRR